MRKGGCGCWATVCLEPREVASSEYFVSTRGWGDVQEPQHGPSFPLWVL